MAAYPGMPPDVAAAALDPANAFGRYVRVALLGAGGMGEVWSAWDASLERWVALKLLKGGDAQELVRFRREAQTAAQLSHPAIAATYEVGESGGRPFIAMQLVHGHPASVLPRNDVRRIAMVLRHASDAVAYAHDHGVVHRDLKPANIMVEELPGKGDRAYVLDFGLAKRVACDKSLTQSGMMLGTPAYMSPEQARGEIHAVKAASDVYSLGATLYDLLAGRPPFEGETVYDLLTRVVSDDPPPLRRRNRRVDADLETIVMKCLEKEPSRRYPGARDLAEDLGRWLAGDPIRARPAGTLYRIGKAMARRKAAVAAAALGGLVALLVAVYALLLRPRELALSRDADLLRLEQEVAVPLRERLKLLPGNESGRRRGLELVDEALRRHERSTEIWMWKADLLEKLGDEDAALDALERACSLNPRLGTARYRRGRILMDHGNEAEAMREFEEALRFSPDDEYALAARARLAMLQGLYREALELCAQADTRGEHVYDYHFVRAFVHGDTKREFYDAEAAMADYSKAIEVGKRRPNAYFNRGILKYDRRDFAGAVEDYSRSIALRPKKGDCYVNRGNAYREMGDVPRALADYARALELNPEDAKAFDARADVRADSGDLGGAIADYGRAIALRPDDASYWRGRAGARQAAGDLDGALADYDRALQLKPDDPEVLTNRGNVHDDRGDHDRAIEDYDRAIALAPHLAQPHFNRGMANTGLGRRAAALEDFNRALERDPRYVKAHYEIGLARHQMGELAAAVSAFTRAIEMDARFAGGYAGRGLSRLASGDSPGALEDFDRAIELDPQDAKSHANRGLLWQGRAEHAKAAADFEAVLRLLPANSPIRGEIERLLRASRER